MNISLYAKNEEVTDGRGYNTSIIVDQNGAIVARTVKMHIPVTSGYYEDKYFKEGPANIDSYAVHHIQLKDSKTINLGLPTCWDQWFPELARCYSLGGAEVYLIQQQSGANLIIQTSIRSHCGGKSWLEMQSQMDYL